MNRRDFILGSALAICSGRAHAQSSAAPRKIGWLLPTPPTNPPQGIAFIETLAKLGWIEGQSIQIERRYAGDAADEAATLKARAKELVALKPEIIFTATSPAVDALRRETTTIPIVFVGVNNPLAADFVSSLAHPGGNITGFANVEPTTIGKMIELLKDVAPRTRAVAILYGSTYVNFKRDWIISQDATDTAAKALSVELSYIPVGNEQDIDHAFERFGRDQTTAVIILADVYLLQQRKLVVASAAQHRVPTIFPFPIFTSIGGLMSYGSSLPEQFQQAAGYVDRILKGANPGDLPVQMPTKYELVINMKAANALAVTVPPSLLATADKVIE